MKLKKLSLLVCSLTVLFVETSHSESEQQQWINSCPNTRLCFDHPKNLVPANVQIIDSSAGKFYSDSLTLTYDLGWYASQFSEMTKATIEPITIDGHSANILIQDNRMALSIPKVSGKIRFSMLIEFKDPPQIEEGKKIFNSIKFTDK